MNRPFRLALMLLGTATALTSCDYPSNSPGVDTQYKDSFSWTPTWHTWDVKRDSVNDRQHVEQAGGVGSAAAIKNGTVQDQINSAPSGKNVGSPQSASGALAPIDQSPSNSKTPVDKSQAPK